MTILNFLFKQKKTGAIVLLFFLKFFFAHELCRLDEKSNGFQLEKSEIRSVMALSRLCLVVAFAALWLTSQGEQVVAHGLRRRVDCHWFRGNSYLRIGWDWLKAVVHKECKLFSNMTLNGRSDPEPAMASRKQERKKLEREFTVKSFTYMAC